MIGGNGPHMLKIAAQYADTWNTFGGINVKSFEEMLTLTRHRNVMLDGYCAEIGRDPTTLRRSVLIYQMKNIREYTRCLGHLKRLLSGIRKLVLQRSYFFTHLHPC